MSVDRVERLRAVSDAQAARAARRRLFANHLFADPAWDILLALYETALHGHECKLEGLSSAGLAMKPLLLWIDALGDEGLVAIRRTNPPSFRLTLSGLSRMDSFFSSPIDASHC
ncbi:MAG: hypothetical protein ACJ8F4_10200 [Sphingomonas sp.]